MNRFVQGVSAGTLTRVIIATAWLLLGWSDEGGTLTAQELGQEAPAPESAAAELPVTADEIEQGIKHLEEKTELEGDDKTTVLQLYQQALLELKSSEKLAAKARELEARRIAAPEELRRLRSDLSQPAQEFVMPYEEELSKLEKRLTETQAQLEKAKQALAESDAEGVRRSEKRATLPQLIDQRTQELAELTKQFSLAPAPGELPDRVQASHVLARARIRALQQEIEAARQELQAYDATRELVPLMRDKAAIDVTQLEKKVQLLTEAVNSRRRAEATQQVNQARSDAAQQAYPALREIARENHMLAAERAGSDGVVARIEKVTRDNEAVQQQLEQLRKQMESVNRQFRTVGLTNAIAALLRQDRASLPDVSALRREIRDRQTTISAARFRWLKLDDRRAELADLGSEVQRHLRDLTLVERLVPGINVRDELRDLLETQRAYLDSLIADYDTYFRKLAEISNRQQELMDAAQQYASFIDERILWAASTQSLNLSMLHDMRSAAAWLVSIEAWRHTARLLAGDAIASAVVLGLLILSALPLLAIHRLLRAKICACGEAASKRTMDRFTPTLEAFGMTLLQSLLWPGLVWLFAWQLAQPFDGRQLAAALAGGLQLAAAVYFPIELLRQICRPRGLAESHFGWSEPRLRRLRRKLHSLAIVLLPAVVLAGAMELQSVEAWSDSLGRGAFLVGMLALAWFLEQMLRPSCGVLKEHIGKYPNGWLAWLHYIWYPAAPVVPLALSVMAALGYYYTALHLATRLLATLCLVLALVVAHAMVRRWLIVTRRHLAIQQARERRAQALSAQESPAPTSTSENVAAILQEPEIDLSTINDQMSRLARGIIGALGVVGLWFIWIDVLPALGVLRQVPLWTTSIEIVKEIPQEDGTMLRRVIPTNVEITLADVGVAMLVAALTVIATRNIPGFIEIFALQRLPMDRGTRYAIATMSSYAITVIGILIGSQILGIGWSKVQWLVAAAALGLGFGLQEIFANLVSGMMILVERPIRVGDVVSVDNVTGVVSRVRIRATTITSWDRQELIIPNKEFITGRVMNWTLSDHVNRIVITVGVAYGSDTEQARNIILQIAKQHPTVLADPEPTVFFEAFADSSLTLTLRAYLPNLENRLPVIHELHTAIDRAFRQANIEIAFPQRDLHVRSVPPSLAALALQASHIGNGQDVKTAQAS